MLEIALCAGNAKAVRVDSPQSVVRGVVIASKQASKQAGSVRRKDSSGAVQYVDRVGVLLSGISTTACVAVYVK